MMHVDTAVVVVCHDQGRTLEEALASFAQPRPTLRELLIVDDRSEDVYTLQVLERCAATHAVVRSAGPSLGAACNLAVSSTVSAAIVIVPANLALDRDYVEEASRLLGEHSDVSFVSPSPEPGGSEMGREPIGRRVQLGDILVRSNVPPWSMFRREAWALVGGFSEDAAQPWNDFCVAAMERGLEGRWLNRPDRTRQLSRPRPPFTPTIHVREMTELYRRHAGIVSAQGTALLLEKERALLEARERHDSLNRQRDELAVELTTLQSAIDEMVVELRAKGRARVELGDLATTAPISPVWGLDRGIPLDRYYISAFLERHREDVRGRVLEVKDAGYTRTFGDGRVTSSDVVDIDPNNDEATVTADLTKAPSISDDTYDCFLLTQTLGVIYDVRAALATAHRVIKPGGVLLCTVPASGRISYEGAALDGDFWRFTEASTRRLFAEVFPVDAFEIVGFGNVLACAAFLYGLAPHELSKADLDAHDPFFPVVYGIRAVKPLRGHISSDGSTA